MRSSLNINCIAQVRKMLNMSQEELSVKAGLHRATIAKFETGDLDIRYDTIARICAVLGLSISITIDMENLVTRKKTIDGSYEKELFSDTREN